MVRRAPTKWTDEEHDAFVRGLHSVGRGRWKDLSRHFVPTRTPTQVASHAQKYFARAALLEGGVQSKRRLRASVFDRTLKKPTPTSSESNDTSVFRSREDEKETTSDVLASPRDVDEDIVRKFWLNFIHQYMTMIPHGFSGYPGVRHVQPRHAITRPIPSRDTDKLTRALFGV